MVSNSIYCLMAKMLATFFFLLHYVFANAQNHSFQVSPQLMLSLPAFPDSMRVKSVNIYTLNADSVYYQFGRESKPLKIKTQNDFAIGLQGLYHGFEPKLAGYAVQKVDTIIGGVQGLYVYAVSKDTLATARQLYMFFTIVDNYSYFIQCSTLLTRPAEAGVRQFFGSVHFMGENYPAKSRVHALSYRAGQALGYLFGLGVLFILIRFVWGRVRKAKIQ